jgi:hypothetical protein
VLFSSCHRDRWDGGSIVSFKSVNFSSLRRLNLALFELPSRSCYNFTPNRRSSPPSCLGACSRVTAHSEVLPNGSAASAIAFPVRRHSQVVQLVPQTPLTPDRIPCTNVTSAPMHGLVAERFLAFLSEKPADDRDGVITLFEDQPKTAVENAGPRLTRVAGLTTRWTTRMTKWPAGGNSEH